jgi:uncharacterized protein Veg
MTKNLVQLIEKVQMNIGEDSFEITNYALSDILGNTKQIKVSYNEGDLTKNYVKYTTDLLSGMYGEEFMEDIIDGFGETLKTNLNNFKESYRNKKSAIKEILPSIFIHTSMSKVLMESMIVSLTFKAKLHIKFHDKIKNEKKWDNKTLIVSASKYKNMSEFSKSEPETYRAVVRTGLKESISNFYKKKKFSEK